nr:MAG TPA: hypothetical protein [Caudoviricetes sp.]
MYSPYLERHNHTFTVALTERQFQWLKAYCTEHQGATSSEKIRMVSRLLFIEI